MNNSAARNEAHSPQQEKGDQPKPDEQILRVEDDTAVIEAGNIDAVAAQLRLRYPDESRERRLHRERDLEAEQRRADALTSLMKLIAETVAREVLQEQAGDASDLRTELAGH